MPETPPLILTLQLDEPTFTFFNALRQQNFPAHLNYLDAHLTLFHHLPNNPAIPDLVKKVAAEETSLVLTVNGVIKLGRGVAYSIECAALKRLHRYLQQQWQPWLTPQDQQGLRPHVTVQNKVAPAVANALFTKLSATFSPFAATGTGLGLWAYQGGPWQKVQDFKFTAPSLKLNQSE